MDNPKFTMLRLTIH